MKKQNFILGTVLLVCASFFAKIIGAIYRIPLTNILGAEGLGIYQLIFPLYSTILVFCSTGVPNAIAKIVASADDKDCRRVVKLSLIFFTALSFVFALLLVVFSKFIANLQGNEQVALAYIGIAPAILFVGILSVFRGFFQGKQNIIPTSVSMIVEQIFKLLFGLFFAKLLIDKGFVYGAFGAVLGVSVSELLALIVITIEFAFYKKKNNNKVVGTIESKITISYILKTALPITFSSMIMPLTILIDSFLIVNLLKYINYSVLQATNLYGIFTGVVNSLINVPVVLSMAVATMSIPIISKLHKSNNIVELTNKSSLAFKLVLLIAIPSVLIFAFFSYDIITFLFKNGLKVSATLNEFEVASNLLTIGSISVLFIALVQISTTILQALNIANVPIKNMIFSCFIKIVLTVVLVVTPSINIYGAIISSTICYLICAILNIVTLVQNIKIKISFRYDIVLPIVASIMMLATMHTIKYLLTGVLVVPFMFICGGVMYCLVYAILSYGEKYNLKDISNVLRKFANKKM